jgi:hypothetical protein
MDNERQRAYEQRLKDADDLRVSNSYVVFLGWIVVEVAAAAIYIWMADNTPRPCTGFCSSSRQEGLVFMAMGLGAPLLFGQFVFGLLVTAYLNRQRYSSFAAGSIAFFTTTICATLITAKVLGM